MTIEQKLSMALSYKGISQSELAHRIGSLFFPMEPKYKIQKEGTKHEYNTYNHIQ